MNRYLGITLGTIGLLLALATGARPDDATLLPNAIQYFMDANGKPLANGRVYMYTPSTTTPKTTWTTASKAVAQPLAYIPLGISGKPANPIYGEGSYRQLVKDSAGNTIWDFNTASTGGGSSGGGGTATGDGDLVGTVKPWAGLVAPNQYLFAYGQAVSRATYPELLTAISQVQSVVCTSGLNVLSGIADTSQLPLGGKVEASCVAPGVTITAKAANSVTVSGNASVSTVVSARFFLYGNGDGSATFNLPDLRGRVVPGRNNMGGTPSAVLTAPFYGGNTPDAGGATGGSQSREILTDNLPPYTPTGTVTNGAITVSALGGTTGVGFQGGGTSTTAAPHTAIVPVQGTSTFAGDAQGGASVLISLIQPSITLNYIVKVTPDTNSATASGVTSIEGMTGDIACGSGLLCTGNIIDVAPTSTSEQVFVNKAAIAGATIDGGVLTARTMGYSIPGDNGGAVYIRDINPCAAVTWQVQSLDGQCWMLSNRTTTPEMFSCIGDGTTNNTACFQSIAAYLNSQAPAAVTLNGNPGAQYKIWNAGSPAPNLMVTTGLEGFVWNFNGSCIVTDQVFVGTVGVLGLAHFKNVTLNDPCYVEQSWSVLSNVNGGVFVTMAETAAPWSENLIINNLVMNGGVTALIVSGDVASPTTSVGGEAKNIFLNNADISNVYYGMVFQGSGDNFTGRGIKGSNNGRLYFPQSVSNHKVEMIADGGPNDQMLFKVYAYPNMMRARRGLSNFDVTYRLPSTAASGVGGELSSMSFQQMVAVATVSGAANNGAGKVRLTVNSTANMLDNQTWFFASIGGTTEANGTHRIDVVDATHVDLPDVVFATPYTAGGYGTVPATIKDLSVHFDIENQVSANGHPLFSTSKVDVAGVADTVTRGYEVSNISLSGRSTDFVNSFSTPAFRIFSDASQGTWGGETINNFAIRNFVLSGSAALAHVAVPNAGNTVNLENIVSTGATWTLSGTASGFNIMNVAATGVTDRNTVQPATASANQFANAIDGNGLITFAQPTIAGIAGLGANVASWLGTPSSANLRAAVTDETGTGALYFQNGDLGTPSAGVATNITALNATQLTTGTVPNARLAASGAPAQIGAVARVVRQSFCPSGCSTTIASGGSGTYTPTTGLLYAVAGMCGGGGAGGGVVGTATNTFQGGGGGAGGFTQSILSAATISTSKQIFIGALGAAGAAGANPGGNGGDTCLTATNCSSGQIVVAKGGTGGGFSQLAVGIGVGGLGGVAGTGDLVATGAPGLGGQYYGAGTNLISAGIGGSSPFGGGGKSAVGFVSNTAGNAASGYCAGGGGAFANALGDLAGGAGTAGLVWITEYVNQ